MRTGLTGVAEMVVGVRDTAVALGSGDVRVLGTPRVVALAEEATVAALRDELGDGETSVGSHVELEHLRPSPIGAAVRAEATVTEVDGRRVTLTVTVTQDGREVARGRIARVVVDRSKFAGD